MIVNNFIKIGAPFYKLLLNKYGENKANKYIKNAFVNIYIETALTQNTIKNILAHCANDRFEELNIIDKINKYINTNEVDTKKLEDLVTILEELI